MSDNAEPMDRRRPFVVGEYYNSRDEKQRFLRRIFDDTAEHYEGIARWGWFGTGARYRRDALRRHGLRPGMRAIDVASGTGQVARELVRILGGPEHVVCTEPSAGMIAELKKSVSCEAHQATAEALPVPDASFDFLTMGFALRHVDDLEAAFREFRRVLKPGGTALILDVTVPEHPVGRSIFKAYFKHILPQATYVFARSREARRLMRYYWDTMEQMTPREEVTDFLRQAGFSEAEHKILLGCFSEYAAKR